jgi:hypothetical protein
VLSIVGIAVSFSVPCALSVFSDVASFWHLVRLLSVEFSVRFRCCPGSFDSFVAIFLFLSSPSRAFRFVREENQFSLFCTLSTVRQFERTDHIRSEINVHEMDEGCFFPAVIRIR